LNYSLHPGADQDLRETASFYREQAGSSLARSFLAEFERCVALLLDYPGLGAVWLHGKRRMMMRRFPFAIIYIVSDGQVRILAVHHHSRRPDHWQGRE
jgi:plasmid stabilization system protein ParE